LQDLKFPNYFSKNPFEVCDCDSFFLIGAEFLKFKDEHNLLFVCDFFQQLQDFFSLSLSKTDSLLPSSFFFKKNPKHHKD
jgi:hypothetical protein